MAESIWTNNQGHPFDTIDLAKSLDTTVRSSALITLLGSSYRYGLTTGSTRSPRIGLTPLGSSIVAPTEGSDPKSSLRQALLFPDLYARLLPRLDRKVIPKDEVLRNTLIKEFDIPAADADACLRVLRQNFDELGLSQDLKGTPYLQLDRLSPPPITGFGTPVPAAAEGSAGESGEETGIGGETSVTSGRPSEGLLPPPPPANQRVFIAHGKNKEIVGQIKELLTFGKFVPVVAEEHETASRPVSEKVMADMRSCFAGVLHVESEEELMDKAGDVHHVLNQNVLIEIGAALALYSNRFVLLVQKGVHLPSNLQGLYRCDYSGDKLDYEATMKLLKVFNDFRS